MKFGRWRVVKGAGPVMLGQDTGAIKLLGSCRFFAGKKIKRGSAAKRR